jgi:predicted ArsR family transcriptional regulator
MSEQMSLIPAYLNASVMEDLVLAVLREHGPLTPDQIAAVCNIPVTSIRPRVTGLLAKGAIALTGERRPTPAAMATGRKITAAVVRIA